MITAKAMVQTVPEAIVDSSSISSIAHAWLEAGGHPDYASGVRKALADKSAVVMAAAATAR